MCNCHGGECYLPLHWLGLSLSQLGSFKQPQIRSYHNKNIKRKKNVFSVLHLFFVKVTRLLEIRIFCQTYVVCVYVLTIFDSLWFMILQQPGYDIIAQFIIGYVLPGKPIANLLFKIYGRISTVHALSFLSDLKLGHYMKIPPRCMYTAQVISHIHFENFLILFLLRFGV